MSGEYPHAPSWLIVYNDRINTPQYYSGDNWTTNPLSAVRYAYKARARAVMWSMIHAMPKLDSTGREFYDILELDHRPYY